jgi:regulatory protein
MQKQVNRNCIEKGLAEREEGAYRKILIKLAIDKLRMLKSEKNSFIRKRKTAEYLLQKGYIPPLIKKLLDSIN